MRIASRGAGRRPPGAARPWGSATARWGWEPLRRAARASATACISFDNRGIGESEKPPGPVHGRASWPRTRCRCSTSRRRARARRRREPRRHGRAGARARASRARRPARARLHDARRRGRLPDARADACGCSPRSPTLAPEVALRRFVENAARRRAAERRRRDARRRRREPARPGRLAGAGRRRRRPSTPSTGSRGSRRRRSSSPATQDNVVDSRNSQRCSPSGSRARALRALPRHRPPVLLGAARARSPRSLRSSSMRDSTGCIRDRARNTPDRVAIDDGDARWTYAELDAPLATSSPASLAHGDRVATLTGNSAEHVAVFFACAKAGAILHAALVAALAARARLPARRRRAVAAARRRTSSRDAGRRGRVRSRRRARASSPAAEQQSVARPGARRSAAPDLHLGHDRAAEGRAAHARELLLDEPLVRPRDRRRPDDVVLQVLPQFHVGGWNVQPLLAWWKGATVVLERELRRRRARSS